MGYRPARLLGRLCRITGSAYRPSRLYGTHIACCTRAGPSEPDIGNARLLIRQTFRYPEAISLAGSRSAPGRIATQRQRQRSTLKPPLTFAFAFAFASPCRVSGVRLASGSRDSGRSAVGTNCGGIPSGHWDWQPTLRRRRGKLCSVARLLADRDSLSLLEAEEARMSSVFVFTIRLLVCFRGEERRLVRHVVWASGPLILQYRDVLVAADVPDPDEYIYTTYELGG